MTELRLLAVMLVAWTAMAVDRASPHGIAKGIALVIWWMLAWIGVTWAVGILVRRDR